MVKSAAAELHCPIQHLTPTRCYLRRTALFNGAAVSAFFAVILVVTFTVRTKPSKSMYYVIPTTSFLHVTYSSATYKVI